MPRKLKTFCTSQDGAVTVDWVVLTAAVVLMAGVVMIGIVGSTGDLGEILGVFMTDGEAGNF